MAEKFDFEAVLEAELDSHLTEELAENRKNGKSKKTVKGHLHGAGAEQRNEHDVIGGSGGSALLLRNA